MIKNQLLTKKFSFIINAAALSTLLCASLGAMELCQGGACNCTQETTNAVMSDVQAYNQMAVICGVAPASTDTDRATIDFINKTIKISLDQFYATCCVNLLQSGGELLTQELFNEFLVKQANQSATEAVVAEPVLGNSELISQN